MGWEQRGSYKYYYRKERDGSRVKSFYVGRGEFADLTAKFDAMQRHDKKTRSIQGQLELHTGNQANRNIDVMAQLLSMLTDAVLITGGFHQHRRQWRKRRR